MSQIYSSSHADKILSKTEYQHIISQKDTGFEQACNNQNIIYKLYKIEPKFIHNTIQIQELEFHTCGATKQRFSVYFHGVISRGCYHDNQQASLGPFLSDPGFSLAVDRGSGASCAGLKILNYPVSNLSILHQPSDKF